MTWLASSVAMLHAEDAAGAANSCFRVPARLKALRPRTTNNTACYELVTALWANMRESTHELRFGAHRGTGGACPMNFAGVRCLSSPGMIDGWHGA
jgi:hypothetical protein